MPRGVKSTGSQPTTMAKPKAKPLAKTKGKSGKGKGKGKGGKTAMGKAKAKAKGKGRVVPKAELVEEPVVEEVPSEPEVVEGPKPKATPMPKFALRKKLLEEIGDSSIADVKASLIEKHRIALGYIEEVQVIAEAQSENECEAREEIESAGRAMRDSLDMEFKAKMKLAEIAEKRRKAAATTEEKRKILAEENKKFAMLEVISTNNQKMKEVEAKRKAATEAAEWAKRNLEIQRQREKDALEATRRTVAEVRASEKGTGKGRKRALPTSGETSPAKRSAGQSSGDAREGVVLDID